MEEQYDYPYDRPRKRGPIRMIFGFIGRILFLAFTLCLIGVCTAGVFAFIFMTYVETELTPTLQVNADDYTMNQSSIVYYHNPEVETNDGWVEYKILHDQENRILVDMDQIPDAMWQATVAIEDHRFFEHNGVDWKRTGGAVLNMFLSMKDTFGGSTITQQLLKNMTDDNKPYVSRKVREIFRALEFEKNNDKFKILELYLNTIYFGKGCYGVETAAQYYFNKDVSELSVAECASIVAITNNPSMYGPMSTITVKQKQEDGSIVERSPREMNKERQEMILERMWDPELGLNYLTYEEYQAAKNQELQFAERSGTYSDIAENGEDAVWSWFLDQVFNDVRDDLCSQYGISSETAVKWIYNKGYRIYMTLDPHIQAIADAVYQNRDNLDLTSRDGQPIRSAITILNPENGDIVAIVGDMEQKSGNRVLSYASERHQVGSSIKPLTVYSPALDAGVVTPATSFDDYPVMEYEGSAWPKNSPPGYGGWTNIKTGVRRSINTIAVQTLQALGVEKSFAFATDNLHLSLTSPEENYARNDMTLAALGMGGLTYGLSTIEMAGAYGAIANRGIYNKPRTFIKVTDADGNLVLSNEGRSNVAMKETTAYLMTDMLEAVVESGTGTAASFDGMHIAGKTGTTSDNFDRYFVGYTPYYVAAVWTGYKYNARINYSGNPAITMWKKVMERIHAELPDKEFPRPETGLETVYVCQDSGMLISDACRNDLRGNRVIAVEVEEGTAPTERCTLHVWRKYCTSGHVIASKNCPSSKVISVGLLDCKRENYGSNVYASDGAYRTTALSGRCSVHGGNSSSGSSSSSRSSRTSATTGTSTASGSTSTSLSGSTSGTSSGSTGSSTRSGSSSTGSTSRSGVTVSGTWNPNYDPEINDPTVPRQTSEPSGGTSGGTDSGSLSDAPRNQISIVEPDDEPYYDPNSGVFSSDASAAYISGSTSGSLSGGSSPTASGSSSGGSSLTASGSSSGTSGGGYSDSDFSSGSGSLSNSSSSSGSSSGGYSDSDHSSGSSGSSSGSSSAAVETPSADTGSSSGFDTPSTTSGGSSTSSGGSSSTATYSAPSDTSSSGSTSAAADDDDWTAEYWAFWE